MFLGGNIGQFKSDGREDSLASDDLRISDPKAKNMTRGIQFLSLKVAASRGPWSGEERRRETTWQDLSKGPSLIYLSRLGSRAELDDGPSQVPIQGS